MRVVLLKTLLVVLLAAGAVSAAGYKVTKVIEVGPAATVIGMSGSVKWSPDGTMLAYFANNYLMVSDTLGNSRQVAAIPEQYPVRAEWASGTEFAVRLKGEQRSDSTLYQLLVYDIESGESRLVDEYWRHRWSLLPGHTYFEGPYITLEGNTYYERINVTGNEKGTMSDKLRSTKFDRERLPISSEKAATLQLDHLVRWGDDGLYEITLDFEDSVRLAPKPFDRTGPFTDISEGRAFAVNGGHLLRLVDSTSIVLDTFPYPRPGGTGVCGFLFVSFNPARPELLFQLSCDIDEATSINRVGVFDCIGYGFTMIDVVPGSGSFMAPTYSPNGRMIALTSDYKAYIIWREEE